MYPVSMLYICTRKCPLYNNITKSHGVNQVSTELYFVDCLYRMYSPSTVGGEVTPTGTFRAWHKPSLSGHSGPGGIIRSRNQQKRVTVHAFSVESSFLSRNFSSLYILPSNYCPCSFISLLFFVPFLHVSFHSPVQPNSAQ